MRSTLTPCVVVLGLFAPDCVHAQATPAELDRVVVVGRSNYSASPIDVDDLPYLVWTLDQDPIGIAPSLIERLAQTLPGVQTNDIQGNGHLGEVMYHGFRASALVGAPQGLSVFLDGVRLNAPFGDVVNWQLVPERALQGIELHDSASPAFGLNTIGGAIVLTTHDGHSSPGMNVDAALGSDGSYVADASLGASNAKWNSYVSVGGFGDDGWRDASESQGGHAFAKLGHETTTTRWNASLLWTRADLTGNGLVPVDLYARDRAAVYTYPDNGVTDASQATVQMRHQWSSIALSALAYARRSTHEGINGDVAEAAEDEDEAVAPAVLNGTELDQRSRGMAVALASNKTRMNWEIGANADASDTTFAQTSQPGNFTEDRGVIATGDAAVQEALLAGDASGWAAYATGTWPAGAATQGTATLRYGRNRVQNRLRVVDDDTNALRQQDETFRYSALTPAFGIVHKRRGALWFANVARNTRIPTAIELGCADPAEPCRLPAGLQSDPYLHEVSSRSIEAGVRSPHAASVDFAFVLYRIDNHDDIVFQSVGATSQRGYFRNIPLTRHQGIDATLGLTAGDVDLRFSYGYLDATYEADVVLRAGDRDVHVRPGTRMAGLSRHAFKVSAEWEPSERFTFSVDAQAFSRRIALGAEEDRSAASPGFAVLDLAAEWPLGRSGLRLFARLNNAFDRRYENYAAWGTTAFNAAGQFTGGERDVVFVAPGAPRSVQMGILLQR